MRGKVGPATMREVAERAGVALTTVSRAFSNPDKLSPDTLRRIADASAELQYTVNLSARSLRKRSSGMLLVLLPDIGNPFFSLVLKGIEEGAREGGRVLLIGDTGSDATLADAYAGQLDAGTVDGMILIDGRMPFAPGSPARARLMRAPVVALSEHVDPAIPFVGIDNRAAGRDVAHLLADLGHRRLGHIAGPAANSLTALRAQGFAEGARERGCDLLGTAAGDWSIGSGQAAAAEILSWPRRPTAIFAANDEMAIGAIHALAAAGVSVPGEISVVGFDDIDFAAVGSPALTTVRQPRFAMGRAAVEAVTARIGGRTAAERARVLPFERVMRASAGPPGGAGFRAARL
jgi:LacI family repressor for deo operon, udp, cdd, tsx, nupC, and nupG